MIGFDCSQLEECSTSSDPEQSDLNEICITNGINIKKFDTEAPKVTSLELFFNGFVDLHCLKKFPQITNLVIFGSDLSALFRVDFGACLVELWLCETKLKRIPDLTACPHIEMLYLYGNKLNKIDNLDHLKNLQILDLAENLLEDLSGIGTLTELNELNLASNRIRKIGPELEKLKKLNKLDLSGNPIDSLVKLNPLRNLFLTELNIARNIYPLAPICRLQNYQLQVCYTLPSLTRLDGDEVCKRIVTEAIKVIKRKIIYYNMKNTILKRSLPEYIAAIRNLSESRLNVPMEAIKDLKAELFRVRQKTRESSQPLEKAAIRHKIDLLEVRLNYWKEFHRKLQREERKAFQALRNNFKLNELMIKLELQSGGNIRFEEAEKDELTESTTDSMHEELESVNFWSEVAKLVDKNCAQNRRTVLGIEEIQINRITRIFHRPKRMKFDEDMDEIFYQTNYSINQSYVFLQADPTRPEETIMFIDKGIRPSTNNNILCTSPFDADTRFNKNYNSSYPPASCHLLICRVYLGRSVPVKGDQWDTKSYSHAESIYEETLNGRKYSLLSDDYLLPEYVIEMEYIPKPRSFPPLIFHNCLDNQRHQFSPRPTQAQEDKDYEVKNCHPKTSPKDITQMVTGEISHLTSLALVGQDLEQIPNLIMFPHLKELNVSCNRLTAVERVIKCSRQLQVFDGSHNNITSFDLPEFKQLHTLLLSWNHLSRLHQLIALFNSKTPGLATLDLRSNFFKEENDEVYSKTSVFDHCAAKITSLKTCNGIAITDVKRQALQEQLILNRKIIHDRGRNGNANGCIRLCNSSQYLHSSRKVADMSKITSLCLDEMGLSSIAELKYVPALRYLSIRSNHINDLSPLKGCTKLVEVCASDNELVRVSNVINSFPSLTLLDLSHNQILELTLDKGLIYLTSLNLSGNRISQVNSYIKLKKLRELYLANNRISDCNELIHLKNCPALEILDIISNPFRDKLDNAPNLFIMYHFTNLKALDGQPVEAKDVQRAKDIFGGRLTNDFLVEKFGYQDGVSRVNLSTIDELDLRDCDIRSVHLESEKLSNLTSLNMMGNLLTHFSGLVYLKELKTLCLNNNNIESVFPLTKHQRAQMNRSQYSQYQKKDVTEKRLTAKASDDCDLLPNLEVLHLGSNRIKEMSLLQLKRFPALKSLFLDGNDITKIDGLDGCSHLRHLVLDRNRIKQIDPTSFQGQWRLEELHLDSNRLTYMSNIRPLVNLKRLYLGMNRIQEVEEIVKLRPLTSLLEVSMIGNGLARRMLHRPMLIWHVPSVETIDGMKVSIEERRNAEAYFLDQGHEPVFHMFDTYTNGFARTEHQNGTTTPSLSTVLSHGYKAYPNAPIKGTVARLQNQQPSPSKSPGCQDSSKVIKDNH